MSDWDQDSADELPAATAKVAISSKPIAKPAKSKWAEEDAVEAVKDDWDASEDEAPAPVATGPAPPVRQKGITKQKIAEKEAMERAAAEKRAAQLAAESDPVARQRAAREREMKADLENARGLFGDDAVASAAPADDPFAADPHTSDDFAAVSAKIAELISSKWGHKPLYAKFVEEHCKALCQPLKDIEVRAASSKLAALANEKQAAAKAGTGKKKAGKTTAKPTLAVGKTGGARAKDTDDYGDDVLDDDDFM